jgi:hypothetical protein
MSDAQGDTYSLHIDNLDKQWQHLLDNWQDDNNVNNQELAGKGIVNKRHHPLPQFP